MKKELLFSVTKKDLKVQTFYAGGPGGQNQNKRATGVRITHPPSGAVGQSREHRTQLQNKRAALKKLADSQKFRTWVKLTTARMNELETPEQIVDKLMHPSNLKIETQQDNKWVEIA